MRSYLGLKVLKRIQNDFLTGAPKKILGKKIIERLCLGTIGLIVAPSIFALEASLLVRLLLQEHQISAKQL